MKKEQLYKIRYQNLMRLVRNQFKGNRSAFGRAVGLSPTYVGFICQPFDKSSHKNIGKKVARQIEEKLSLPDGYIDAELSTNQQLKSLIGKTIQNVDMQNEGGDKMLMIEFDNGEQVLFKFTPPMLSFSVTLDESWLN